MQARGLNQPDRSAAMAQAGAVLVKLGRADAGRKLIDEAAQDAAQLGTEGHAGYYRWLVAEVLAPFDLKRALALIEPIKDDKICRERRAGVTRGSPPPSPRPIRPGLSPWSINRWFFVLPRAGQDGDRLQDRRDLRRTMRSRSSRDQTQPVVRRYGRPRRSAGWRWPWRRAIQSRAFGLIDRALAMMIDHRDAVGQSEDEMAVAARIAICARRIGYPDMESVLLRVLATRSADDSPVGGRGLMRFEVQAALALALTDPATARALLEEIAARSGLDPTKEWDVREPWLTAWALVDLDRAEALFESAPERRPTKREKPRSGTPAFSGWSSSWSIRPIAVIKHWASASSGGFWWPDSRR